MTNDEWKAISLLLDKGFKWREPFGEVQAGAYRTLLEGHSAEEVMGAIRTLVARGQVFGPAPGELVSLIHTDPSKPTFVEALALIYGRGGILRARPEDRMASYADLGEQGRAYQQAARQRAAQMHPLVASFVDRYGIERLRTLELDHEDYGELKKRELEAQWDAHCEAYEGRETYALATGRRGEGLAQLDPLAALGVTPPGSRPALNGGTA